MPNKTEVIQADTFYHIYNKSNGNEKLFLSDENYRYFLKQWAKHIGPIADTYAYCLIPNHFHFVIKIKSDEQLLKLNLQGFQNLGGLKGGLKNGDAKNLAINKQLSQRFSNFFNAYTKAFNKMHGRTGSLFNPNFKRKVIANEEYLRQVILYVHLNPVKHQVSEQFETYPYSSFLNMVSSKPTLLQRKRVIDLYDDIDNFKFVHQQQKLKTELITELILEDE